MRRGGRSLRWCLLVLALALLLGGCASVGYYAHVTRGEAGLLLHRRPVDEVLRDPATPPVQAARLRLAEQARRFASARLDLPDNRSYTSYVALDRPYVAWNVFVAPRFAVQAVPQCFPFAGCVAYRGYFQESRARRDAARQRAKGRDVWIGGVPAYSTLGWFADPLLSSMLRWDDDELAGTIFHELAHQRFYLKGDTAFNESYATFVQREGLREWRQSRGLAPPDGRAQAMDDGFTALVLGLRQCLERAYARGGDDAAREVAKQREIEAFRQRYQRWRDAQWPGDHRYDAWVAEPINNARLLPFGLYDRWAPAFGVLFVQSGGQWPAFFARVRELARQPEARRRASLDALLGMVHAGPGVAGTLATAHAVRAEAGTQQHATVEAGGGTCAGS